MVRAMTDRGDPETVVRAPPRAAVAKRLGVLFALGVALAVLGTQVVLPGVRSYLFGATRLQILERAEHVMFAVAALLAFGAVVSLVHGVRILRAGRWPLRGAFVVRDTVVRRGRGANLRGWTLVLLAVLQLALALWTSLLPRMLYGSLSFA